MEIVIKEHIRKERDWQSRKIAADAVAQHFDTDVFIPPIFRTTRDWRYSYFYDKLPIPGKMPDLKFKNEWWEMESYEGDFKIKHITKMLRSGGKQAKNVIIKMNHNYDIDAIKQVASKYLGRKEVDLNKVMILDSKGNIHTITNPPQKSEDY